MLQLIIQGMILSRISIDTRGISWLRKLTEQFGCSSGVLLPEQQLKTLIANLRYRESIAEEEGTHLYNQAVLHTSITINHSYHPFHYIFHSNLALRLFGNSTSDFSSILIS